MTEQLSNIDKSLLSYLEEAYNIKNNSVLYNAAKMLLERLWQGSICVSFDDLKAKLNELKKEDILNSSAVGKKDEIRPLILIDDHLYIQRYYTYQKRIVEKLELLCKNNKLVIITGGPGTGKTTSLAKELSEIITDKKILLAAPTGKAAFRMNEALKKSLIYDEKKEHTKWIITSEEKVNQLKELEAKTINRLLGTNYLSVNFKHNKENRLNASIVVIDECSMVDLPMMAKLLDAIPDTNCYLYLLGDKNQLPSIEAGSVFADICNMYDKKEYKDKVYKVKDINYRSKEAPGIDKLSNNILNNNVDSLNNENVHHYEIFSVDNVIENYKELFTAASPKDALNTLKEFQILCSNKNGRNGTININKDFVLKAKKMNVKYTPIIITENNYTLKLYNGDVGVRDEKYAYFFNNDTIETYLLLTLPAYDDAFAITIHKSQGSEYTKVAVVYPEKDKIDDEKEFFTKELLYTAITRAKKDCFIYGCEKILLDSCKRKVFRASGIK